MKWSGGPLDGLVKGVLRVLLRISALALPRPRFEPAAVHRILVFSYQGLGNFIMYTPALRLLRERYPEAAIDLQVGGNRGCKDVLWGAGLFDSISYVPYSLGVRAWIARALEIRRRRYDLTINEFHSHSFLLAAQVVAAGAPFRLGHVTSPGWGRRFSRYSFVFNLKVGMREDEHEVERYLDLVERVGARRIPLLAARPFVHIEESDRLFGRRFLEAAGLERTTALIGIQPGSSLDMTWKQWPLERFRELIEGLSRNRPDWGVLLFGSDAEEELLGRLAEGMPANVVVAAGKTSVKQVAALIERCTALVCNDSGLMHVAVAVGTPVVAIYGPTDIRRTAPLGSKNEILRHDLPCSPCFRLEGDRLPRLCPHHDCLRSITAEEVLKVVGEALNRLSPVHPGPSPFDGQSRVSKG